MDSHVKILGWLYIIYSVLGLLGAICLVIFTLGPGLISQEPEAMVVLSTISVVCGGFLFLVSVPGIIAGIGLLKYKSWGRILGIILGIFNLPSFPIGTAIGIYALWALLNQETKALFESGAEAI